MIKTYQYRIYPTTKQRQTLEAILEACQTLYNQALDMRKKVYDATGETMSYIVQQNLLPPLRHESRFWSSIHIDILQDTLDRLDKVYKAFFERVKKGENPGFPRFKGKGQYRSMTFSHLSLKLIRNIRRRIARLVVPKLGHVKTRYHRPLPAGKIKTLTIQRKASGWYANITVEVADVPKVAINSAVGIDVGLDSFLTTSDGDKVNNPRHFRKSERKLGKAQRRLSKRQKGSSRYCRQRERVAKIHEHIANQRRDFHYKTASALFCEYDTIAVEDLQIRNMVQNHQLAKSISDAAWGNFRLALESKAENAGTHVLKVPPHGTSQNCSRCGVVVKKSLAVRTHDCPDCGLTLDRDHNTAINILRAATVLRGGALVVNSPENPFSVRRYLTGREGSAKPVKSPIDRGTMPNPLGLDS